ncbi:MAG: glucosidase, partial [Caldilineae bacterium]
RITPLRVRSLVGLLPLIAVAVMEPECLDEMPDFARRMRWFIRNRPQVVGHMASVETRGRGERHLAAILTPERLRAVLRYLLDETEFLSPYGIRSLSKFHQAHPYSIHVGGRTFTVNYEPAESRSGLFGGNSNWRGPVWFPLNYLIIESLRRFDAFYGDTFTVEMPTGSGRQATLAQVADELSRRLQRLFFRDERGERPAYAGQRLHQHDPHWRDYILFYEYFHGDNGAGLGASHQTGWTGLVADLIQQAAGSA